jgi:hypothetical protein
MEMLDQPALLGTEENRHIIYYRSRIFPQMYMEGYFSPEPMAFNDSAMNGNTVQWTHAFHVYRTSPRINSAEDMSRVYWSWVRERGGDEVIPDVQVAKPLKLPKPPADPVPETVETLPRNPPDPLPTTAEIFAAAPVI